MLTYFLPSLSKVGTKPLKLDLVCGWEGTAGWFVLKGTWALMVTPEIGPVIGALCRTCIPSLACGTF